MTDSFWRKCSNCKVPISFDTQYWVCNVSTCNRKRTGLIFCSVDCWDAHLPIARHKDAWAEDRHSPKADEAAERKPKRVEMRATSEPKQTNAPTGSGSSAGLNPAPPDEILIIASKVKAYVRARSGLNTSAGVMEVLSDRVRKLCDDAIRSAHRNERKTLMDRDF